MTPEQMQKIVNEAPEGWEWVVISNQGKMVYFKDCIFGLTYYKGGTCWVSANPVVRKYLLSKEDILSQLHQHNTLTKPL